MRKFEKHLKSLNRYCLENQTNVFNIRELDYDINNLKTRAMLAYLQAKEYIKLIDDGSGIFIERLSLCITYFEDKHIKNIDVLKNWTINISIALVSSLFGALLARISIVLFP